MKILQVSAADGGGGAHKISYALHRGLRARGHGSAMAVGRRSSKDPDIHAIPPGIPRPLRALYDAAEGGSKRLPRRWPGVKLARKALLAPNPIANLRDRLRGREHFGYPGSRQVLRLPGFDPDLVHCHNLHGEYFDLRYLTDLSRDVPTALTLHDEWTFTGHCAYTLDSERWRTGCGSCPHLDTYPAVRADATHENWLRKQAIYAASRLYVSAPSAWLLDRARESILAEGTAEFRLIPNGVDQKVFRPADRGVARELLGLPPDHLILLFTANSVRTNMFKDYETVAAAAELVAAALGDRQLLLIALGGTGPSTTLNNAELRFLPYENESVRVAAYYQAADLYLHGAHADTFPTTILEAVSVGKPVVATAVGGIHEQVTSLAGMPGAWSGAAAVGAEAGRETATGVLVAPRDAAGMAEATIALLADDDLREQLGRNAAAHAAVHFGLEGQLDATLAWYAESIDDWRRWRKLST